MPSFHWRMSWSVQKRAWFVCSGVLLVLSARPRSLTWLKSSAYSRLRQRVRAVGPELRTALERERPHAGEAQPEHEARGIGLPDAGPGWRRARGPGPWCVHPRPSFTRSASTACGDLRADGDPVRLRLARPGSPPGRRRSRRRGSPAARAQAERGCRPRSVSYAAVATAASGDVSGRRRRRGARTAGSRPRSRLPRRRWRRGRCPCRRPPRPGTCCRSSPCRRPRRGRPERSRTGPRCSRRRRASSRQGNSPRARTGLPAAVSRRHPADADERDRSQESD